VREIAEHVVHRLHRDAGKLPLHVPPQGLSVGMGKFLDRGEYLNAARRDAKTDTAKLGFRTLHAP
jgi:hypothetical protein